MNINLNKVVYGFCSTVAISLGGFSVAFAQGVNTDLSLEEVLAKVQGLLWYVLAAMAFIAILAAAFMFITQAGGSAGKAAQAKRWLVYIIIGLVIGIAANGIIAFVNATLRG